MDAVNLLLNSYHKNFTTNSLSTEEYFSLKNSLMNLKTEMQFKDIFLWGKINGVLSNYYVCYGYEQDALNHRVFYYSNNEMEWNLLPESKPSIQNYLKFLTNFYTGDPAFLSNAPLKPSIKYSMDEYPEKVKEEERLAATITLINEEALILPRGALFKHENGITTINRSFQGLTSEESMDFESYVHYRIPKHKWETNVCTKNDYSYEKDYLDPINSLIPEACWSVQLEDGRKTVILKHLEWIGMTFIHNLGTKDYYSIYIGNGIKNVDASFML